MQLSKLFTLGAFIASLTACDLSVPSSFTPSANNDSDGDGIENSLDHWPDDASKPVTSSLWGIDGENWTTTSRLPLVVFAGYHEGNDPLPNVTRVVANVVDFGATPGAGSANDTQAFLDAIEAAISQVALNNHGVIFVPAGVYDIDKQLHLNKSGLVLKGAGEGQTTLNFTTGVINDSSAIGNDAKRRKLIVLGGNYDDSNTLKAGVQWQVWNADYSAALDFSALPYSKRGDLTLRLASPLSDTLKAKIAAQGNRVRLTQNLNYGELSPTPELATNMFGGPDFSPPGGNGGIWVTQMLGVEIAADNRTLNLDRPLRFTPTAETSSGGARIALRDSNDSWGTEEIGIEDLTIKLPDTDWVDHFGTEGQGGIDMMSDNSWVRNVTLINADNGIEVDKNTFNNTITNVTLDGTRVPRRSGAAELRYDAYGHHGISIKGREHMLDGFDMKVSFVHDVTMNNSHGSVVMNGIAPLMTMDHHRQVIYANLWTNLHITDPRRMWQSTGNPSEGYNSAMYNTFWNITTDTPEYTYWPEDGEGVYPQWGYHFINVIGTDIKSKPAIGEGRRPYPYDPVNAHLETMAPNELWPQNIYTAQREAYLDGRLW